MSRIRFPNFPNVLPRAMGMSLRIKIACMVAGVVLALALITSVVVRANVRDMLGRRLDAHAVTIANAVAAHHTDMLMGNVIGDSTVMVSAMVVNDPEVLYAIVHAPDGTAAVIATRAEAPAEAARQVVPQSQVEYRTGVVETSVGRVHEATVPLPGMAGYVRVGVAEAGMLAAIARMNREVALVVALVLLVAVAASLGMTHWLTRPIVALKRAVRATSLTNLPGGRAEPQMDDEIGELMRAFNRMTVDLAGSRDALLSQNRELAVLNATAEAISGSLDLSQILTRSLEKIIQHMDLRAGWIFLASDFGALEAVPDGERPAPRPAGPLRLVVHSGLSPAFVQAEAGGDCDGCVCLDVLASGRPHVLSFIQSQCFRLSPEMLLAEGLVCHASIPLVARDRVVGVLNVAADRPRVFRDDELRLLGSIGRQVGVAVENARLWDQVRRKEQLRGQLLDRIIRVQEDERRRIALELHDQTGSSLASLGVGLRMLEGSTPLPRAARDQVHELKDQVDQIARDLHQLALELRPLTLDRLGLADAVEQSVQLFARQHGLSADFQAIGLDDARLPAEVETGLYRIVQEALTNVAKHAQASVVGVLLERRGDSVVAVVEDNGRGFAVAETLAVRDGRLGLFGMQERAALVGGRWQVESAPGRGTTVFVEVPLAVASSQ